MFSHNEKDFRNRPVYTSTCICDFIFVCFLSFIRSLCPAQTWNSQFCSRHSFQENPEFISRPKAKPKRSQKRSLISKKRPFTRPGPTLNEAAARDMQNNPHGPKWHIQIPDLPRTRPDAHVVQMHNAQINFSYCWQSILNKYTTHGIEILDVSLWKEVHSWFDKSAFGISVNVLISYGDCTTMVDKIIKSFAKRSRNTKSEASNDSPLSGLFILPIPQIWSFFNLDHNSRDIRNDQHSRLRTQKSKVAIFLQPTRNSVVVRFCSGWPPGSVDIDVSDSQKHSHAALATRTSCFLQVYNP